MNTRFIAARVIEKVTDGYSLTETLNTALKSLTDTRDHALVKAMCFGICRYYTSLDAILSCLLKKPMQSKDSDVHALLLVGLYQLRYMRIPPHAAVAETVNATEKLKKPWSRGFVNAILREYLREEKNIEASLKQDEEYEYAHPYWLIKMIKENWPEHFQTILNENNKHPPLALRVNLNKLSRNEYLAKNELAATIIPETETGIMVDIPTPIEEIVGFNEGFVSVQDGAGQLVCQLLELAPHQRVLDACAAPGSKLTHILESEPQLDACIALEKDPERLQAIKENLSRLSLQAECICTDANTMAWWDEKLFDRILLDAPCSATGVIRRHPDIKLLRQSTDIKPLAKKQLQLLNSLWPLLKPGGIFVYTTCSILAEENEQVVKAFLSTHPDAREKSINASWGLARPIGRQILPGMHNMDGFYYALLERI